MGLISRVSSRTYRKLKFYKVLPKNKKMPNYEALSEYVENRKLADLDPRFRVINHFRECGINYSEYYKCERILSARGDDTKPCEYFKKQFTNLCAPAHIRKWDDMRADKIFWGSFY